MTAVIIIMAAAFFAAVRTIGYGVYTFKNDNKTGGAGLLIIAAVCVAIFIIYLYFVLTNV